MPELITDFVRNGGTYMVVTAMDGLHSNQISRIQHAMLSSVNIPNLLRLDVREVDFAVSLHYEITGNRMLSQCLKQEKIGMAELYGLLLQAVTVLDDCKQYMLSQDKFLMDEDHIFVEESLATGTLHFAYIPITAPLMEESTSKRLITLITRMMTAVTVIEGTGIQQLLRFCSDELFSVTELKKLLLRLLLEDHPSKSVDNTAAGKSVVVQPSSQSSVTIKEYMPPPPSPSPGAAVTPPMRFSHGHEPSKLFAEIGDSDQEEDNNGENEEKSSKKTYFLLGALLAIAMIWKLIYFDHPASLSMIICIVMTVLIVVVFASLLSGKWSLAGYLKLRNNKSDESGDLSQQKEEGLLLDKGWRWNEPLNDLSGIFPGHADILSPALSNRGEIPPPTQESAVNLAPAPPPPRTVLLNRRTAQGSEAGIPAHSEAAFSLDRIAPEAERAESIPLSPGSFVIGRSEEMVQYVDRTAGVSRAHAELMIRSGECSLKDLGSRNGTRLGGEVIAPYKEYPLNPGDSFMIAECTYTLRRTSW